MFLLKAESLDVQSPSQFPIEYLDRCFAPVASFPLSERKDAEQRCVKSSEFGLMTILVEFTESLVLYCEGEQSQLEFQPIVDPQPEPEPVSQTVLMYRGQPVKEQQSVQYEIAAALKQEMRYRGVIVKQPGDASSIPAPDQNQPAKYLVAKV
jgi:hypothetical protein